MAAWEDANARFLAAALTWVRARLDLLAAGEAAAADAKTAADAASTQMLALESGEHRPGLVILANRLGLSRFERDTLLLCAAMDLDPSIASRCAHAGTTSYPTFALALAAFDDGAWDALGPDRPLRYWRLIEIHQPGALSLTAAALRADERIVAFIKGLSVLDDRLHPFITSDDTAARHVVLATSQAAAANVLAEAWARGKGGRVQLTGPHATSKHDVALTAAGLSGLQLLRVPAAWLPSAPAELETFARLWRREGLLSRIAMFLDSHDAGETTDAATPAARILSRDIGPIAWSVRDTQPVRGAMTTVAIDKAHAAEQLAAWRAALGTAPVEEARQLAAQFNLDLSDIHTIAAEHDGNLDRVYEASLAHSRPRLDRLAERIVPRAAWRDLVLPREPRRLLIQLVRHVTGRTRVYDDWGFRRRSHRGLGVSALFAGDSGTGKTMAAEVIANHLGLNLYRVDLSAVVSKYIGETEKNLRKLFDAAEDGGTILFFDEADALFGKRSEVKDSHDRYANIEIDYLLQRMESYSGVAILATNMKSALDQAFLRRLRFVINFPFPEASSRQAIWRKAFPPEVPIDTRVNFQTLGKLNLTGGSIHNIAVNTAFLAARGERAITMPLINQAVRMELRKLERPLNEADVLAPRRMVMA